MNPSKRLLKKDHDSVKEETGEVSWGREKGGGRTSQPTGQISLLKTFLVFPGVVDVRGRLNSHRGLQSPTLQTTGTSLSLFTFLVLCFSGVRKTYKIRRRCFAISRVIYKTGCLQLTIVLEFQPCPWNLKVSIP